MPTPPEGTIFPQNFDPNAKRLLLWLDDVRKPPDESWFWVKTAEDALLWLETGLVEVLSADHDLGLVVDESTGFIKLSASNPLAKDGTWLIEQMIEKGAFPTQQLLLHSQNPVGRLRMRDMILRYLESGEEKPTWEFYA